MYEWVLIVCLAVSGGNYCDGVVVPDESFCIGARDAIIKQYKENREEIRGAITARCKYIKEE